MRARNSGLRLCALLALGLAGCATRPPDILGSGSQLATREYQTREYETLDRNLTLRSVLATLQDLGFVIDSADESLGTVTATRASQYRMRMTVTVREKGADRVLVRANARIGEETVSNPGTYQDFFDALDKAMFLTLHKVD
jgi:hypothetical protein